MVQTLWIAEDLFLDDKKGIYRNMKRDKKNTPINTEYPASKENKKLDVTLAKVPSVEMPLEFNGPKGPEPTRYGDWEQKGRCTDF